MRQQLHSDCSCLEDDSPKPASRRAMAVLADFVAKVFSGPAA
jgi:hypothetical protein